MEKYRAIPQGYMTVGALAKKMNTTVRTLQYYDQEGLLSPSAESEGGRRLYSDKDMIALHQIQSMKYLGFSLRDIKNRLVTLDTPEQVAAALAGQAEAIRGQIASLSEALEAVETLKSETLQMKTVNFRKYADIVVMLQTGEPMYWLAKSASDELWAHIRSNFDGESGEAYIAKQKQIIEQAAKLKKDGTPPQSEQGLLVGQKWWESLVEFLGGDMSLLPELRKFSENRDLWDDEWRRQWEITESYINEALEAYLTETGHYDALKQ
jgi:DNA-binding transcriptional MerR regulator